MALIVENTITTNTPMLCSNELGQREIFCNTLRHHLSSEVKSCYFAPSPFLLILVVPSHSPIKLFFTFLVRFPFHSDCSFSALDTHIKLFLLKIWDIFIGLESDHWECLSVTHWLTWLLFSKLDWCDPGVWRCQLKTCWGCYCCSRWCRGSCWQQFVTDLGADVWS